MNGYKVKSFLPILIVTLFSLSIAANSFAGIGVTDGAASNVVGANKPKVELVFVLDTTGSMKHLIEAAKDKIWSITNTIVSAKPTPEITIGIVGFRDKRDAYVTKLINMTDDLDSVYQELMSFQAHGGGDTPESVNQALYEAVTRNDWDERDSTYKVIFLVGDSPPHMDYHDDVKYQKSCEIAVDKGIIINTIQCGTRQATTPFWREIADLTQGDYFTVSQKGDYVSYSTPYDEEIAKKTRELEKTRVYYGDDDFKKTNTIKLEKKAVMQKKAKPSVKAQRGSLYLKSTGRKNLFGAQELVDSVSSGEVKLEDIKEEELPKNMQKMKKNERVKHIKKVKKKRDKLLGDIKALNNKRQRHIVKEVKKEGAKGKKSLDMKIYNSIKSQAAEKNIEYDSEMPTY
jgi:Mg-chelatase subunit ChlD